MNRKEFLLKTSLAGLALSQSNSLLAQASTPSKKSTKITLLHTNDTHSNIEAFPANHPKFPNYGGVSRRFDLIQKIRSEEKNVLLLDAGDIFQGTPYFNKFKGVLEFKLMSQLGYDAATMGNHDFDIRLEGFKAALPHAKFDFLCSNYDFKNTVLDGLTKPYKIFIKEGIKIGIFGLGVEMKGLIPDTHFAETNYLDPIETAQEMVKQLKQEGAQIIVCLSHLGYEYQSAKISDRVLAKNTSGIDLIIGGHTHTFLEKPTVDLNKEGKIVLINQVGWGGLQVGRIDFFVGKNIKSESKLLYI